MSLSILKEIIGTDLKVNQDGSLVVRVSDDKIYAVSKSKNGYLKSITTYNGGRKTWLVHRLVALAWVENPNGFKVVNHKDGIKTNNHKDNLEWVTHQENCLHARRTGLLDKAIFNQTKHLRNQMVKDLIKLGYTQHTIARAFGMHQANVSRIMK
jgi:hypothetical protein